MVQYHLEPINISFQTTNPELRCKMLHNRFAGEALKKVDKLYETGQDYATAVAGLQNAVNQLAEKKDIEHQDMEKIVGDILLSVSDISRICKIPQEQILTDRIEHLIDSYEQKSQAQQ